MVTIAFFCSLSLQATNYYVATYTNGGRESNTGTSASPFLRIQQAAASVVAGDTVIVRDGTYTDTIPNYGTKQAIVHLTHSGNSSGWITFKAEHKGRVILDGMNNKVEFGFVIDQSASYIRIEGFEIKDFNTWGIIVNPTITSSHFEFRDNQIHHIGNICTATTTGLTGICLRSCDNVLIERNYIHDIGRFNYNEMTCPTAQHYQYNDHGIYVDDVSHLVIQNNIISQCGHGWGIHLYCGRLDSTNYQIYKSEDIDILNNTFYTQHQQSVGLIILSTAVDRINIKNNLLIMNADADSIGTGCIPSANVGIKIDASYANVMSGVVISNNMKYRGNRSMSDANEGTTITDNIIATDSTKTIKSIYGLDFSLPSGSDAINAGLYVGLTTDYVGNTRTVLPDIGAYEYNIPPEVSIAIPTSNTIFTAPASITIIATATDADGTISSVDFYIGSTLLNTVNTRPYLFTAHNVAAGSYAITAKAADNAGASTTSTPVTIAVNRTSAKSENPECYPVPFTGQLHIDLIPIEGESVTAFELFNIAGKCVRSSKQNDTKIVMDLSDLTTGVYVVTVRTNKGVYNKLVIKK